MEGAGRRGDRGREVCNDMGKTLLLFDKKTHRKLSETIPLKLYKTYMAYKGTYNAHNSLMSLDFE